MALAQADRLEPDHGGTLLFLAIAHEETGQLEEALTHYVRCAETSGLPFDLRDDARARAFHLHRELYRSRARAFMQQPGEPRPDVLAIYHFTTPDTSRVLRVLGKGLAEMLITDLAKVESLTLVERLQLDALLKEIGLSQADAAIDPDSRLQAGRLVGAATSLSGSILPLGDESIQMPYYVAHNQTGNLVAEKADRGAIEDLLAIEKRIAFGTIDLLRIEISDAEKQAIGEIPTTDYPALLAFCEGIDLEDRGRYVEALRRFETSVRLDPNFQRAMERAADLRAVTSTGATTHDARGLARTANARIQDDEMVVDMEATVDQRVRASTQAAGMQQPVPTDQESGGAPSPAASQGSIPPVQPPGSASFTVRVPLP